MGVSVHVHQEGRGHEVRRLLGLLVQHVVVGIPDQRPVVCVEEHLVRDLKEKMGDNEVRFAGDFSTSGPRKSPDTSVN